MESNNADPSLAGVGDTVTLTIEADEDTQEPVVIIDGNTATVNDAGDSDAKTWEATYTMKSGNTEGELAFTLNADDLVGNSATEVTTTTDGSTVTFDQTASNAPTVSGQSADLDDDALNYTEAENEQTLRVLLDSGGDDAVLGDTVALYEDGTEIDSTVLTSGNVSDGYVDFTLAAGRYTDRGDKDYDFTADVTDQAGNTSTASTAYTVTVDTISPTVSSPYGDNNGDGETIENGGTGTISFSEVLSADGKNNVEGQLTLVFGSLDYSWDGSQLSFTNNTGSAVSYSSDVSETLYDPAGNMNVAATIITQ